VLPTGTKASSEPQKLEEFGGLFCANTTESIFGKPEKLRIIPWQDRKTDSLNI